VIRAFVDTNVLLRFLAGEPPEMADEATRLFAAVADGAATLIVDDVVIAEAVSVLSSFYKQDAARVADVLRAFLVQEGIEAPSRDVLLHALTFFEERRVDFVDALVAARMLASGVSSVFTFDAHFERLPGIQRLHPGDVVAG